MRNQTSSATRTKNTARSPKLGGIAARLTRVAALLVVATVIGASHVVAWERDAGDRAVPWDPKFSTRMIQDSSVPVLPGVVGPAIDVHDGRVPKAALPDPARQMAGDAMSGGRHTPLVPSPPETWEHSGERRASMTGQKMSEDLDAARSQRQRIGIVLGLVGVIGIVAVMAAVRGVHRRSVSPSPVSVLRTVSTDPRRQRQAVHRRSQRPGIQEVASHGGSHHA